MNRIAVPMDASVNGDFAGPPLDPMPFAPLETKRDAQSAAWLATEYI